MIGTRAWLKRVETCGRSTIDVEDWAATFAATPPYEAFKLQLSLLIHSTLARAVFVTIDGKVYKLLKAMYGLRVAGTAFDRKVLDEFDGSVTEKVQHLCWKWESARDMPR